MSGTLQVGGITLGTHNSGTGKVDITNAGTLDNVTLSGTLTGGTISGTTTFPTGHVLQVKNTLMGDRLNFTPSSQTWTDIAGLSVQITPSSSSNKIMVFATVQGNAGQSTACFLRTS
jgi:hypothetical protein